MIRYKIYVCNIVHFLGLVQDISLSRSIPEISRKLCHITNMLYTTIQSFLQTFKPKAF